VSAGRTATGQQAASSTTGQPELAHCSATANPTVAGDAVVSVHGHLAASTDDWRRKTDAAVSGNLRFLPWVRGCTCADGGGLSRHREPAPAMDWGGELMCREGARDMDLTDLYLRTRSWTWGSSRADECDDGDDDSFIACDPIGSWRGSNRASSRWRIRGGSTE